MKFLIIKGKALKFTITSEDHTESDIEECIAVLNRSCDNLLMIDADLGKTDLEPMRSAFRSQFGYLANSTDNVYANRKIKLKNTSNTSVGKNSDTEGDVRTYSNIERSSRANEIIESNQGTPSALNNSKGSLFNKKPEHNNNNNAQKQIENSNNSTKKNENRSVNNQKFTAESLNTQTTFNESSQTVIEANQQFFKK